MVSTRANPELALDRRSDAVGAPEPALHSSTAPPPRRGALSAGGEGKHACWMPPRNVERLVRVYGPTTWDVYERLDMSLDPAGPESLYDVAAESVRPGQTVLDAGCRDGTHLIELVRRFDVYGVGVEPVAIHVERANAAVAAAGLGGRITLHHGVMHDLPYPDDYFNFVWCRDVLEQVDDLDGGLRELVRVMKPEARLLVYTVVTTDLLTVADAAMMRRHLGNVQGNLHRATLEAAFETSGLAMESVRLVGTEWREWAEERTQPVSRALLRLARLRRQRDEIITDHGQDIYEHIEANLHWEVFQFLGKLEPLVYVLRVA
jgi:ubiquinone/menaquinone biosynthesis C-methylase UbiE